MAESKQLADITAKTTVDSTDKVPVVNESGATEVATFENFVKSIDLSKIPTTSLDAVSDDAYILTANAAGQLSKISKSDLASVVGGLKYLGVLDGSTSPNLCNTIGLWRIEITADDYASEFPFTTGVMLVLNGGGKYVQIAFGEGGRTYIRARISVWRSWNKLALA